MNQQCIRFLIGAVGILAIVAVLGVLLRKKEPIYDGEPLSYWAVELKNANPGRQQQAKNALREIGPQAIPFLLAKARYENSVIKRFYREAWFRLPDVVRQKLRQPQSEDEAIDFISHALHQLGPLAGPALMKAMEDRNSGVRRAAAGSFPYGGITEGVPDTPEVVAWVVKMLDVPDYEPKQSAAMMLGVMGRKAKCAVPALLRVAQRDEFDYVRETAARSLAMLVDPEIASLAPGLKKCLGDRLASVRLWSAIALWRINHDSSAIPVLIADLKTASSEDGTCYAVVHVLGEAGALAKPAVPEIRRIMLQFGPERAQPEGGADLIQAAREALRLIDPEIDPVEMLLP